MTGADLLNEAIAELYSADPDDFVARRAALVSRAREAGQRGVARQIAGLRKPTRSAWIVNQLIRSRPGVITGLSDLGEELRSAQRSLDGDAIRELSRRRRQLVEDLVRQALEVSGQRSPPAAMRDEVTATLSAAVADPDVAGKLASGTLERAAHHEGFGPAGPPVLTLVPPPAEDEPAAGQPGGGRGRGRAGRAVSGAPSRESRGGPAVAHGRPTRGGPAAASGAGAAASPDTATPAERARAERERRLAEAERQAAEAGSAADAATLAEQQQETGVRQLEEQLAQARLRLAEIRQQARRARAGQRRAQQALDRLRQ